MKAQEVLSAPEKIQQSVEEQHSAGAVELEGSVEAPRYMYVREDGTVEKSNSVEDVKSRCPALGRLAIEAPDQFDAMLALSEMTSQRLANETQQKPEKPEPKRENTSPTEEPDKQKEVSRPKAEQVVQELYEQPNAKFKEAALDIVQELDVAETHELPSQEASPQEGEKAASRVHIKETDSSINIEASATPQVFSETEEQKESAATTSETPSEEVVQADNGRELQQEPVDIERYNTRDSHAVEQVPEGQLAEIHKEDESLDYSPEPFIFSDDGENEDIATEIVSSQHEDFAIQEQEVGTDDLLDAEFIASELNIDYEVDCIENIEELIAEEAPMMDSDELEEAGGEGDLLHFYEPEVREVYEAIIEMQEELPEVAISTEEAATESSLEKEEVKLEVSIEDSMGVAEQGTEPITIEAIQEEASTKGLEENLVLLAQHVVSSERAPDNSELAEALDEIEPLIAKQVAPIGASQGKAEITPELTEKLLRLLQVMGYENPKDALLEFLTERDFEYLLRSIQYIYKLQNADNAQEFLVASTAQPIDEEEAPKMKLCRALFKLITRDVLELAC